MTLWPQNLKKSTLWTIFCEIVFVLFLTPYALAQIPRDPTVPPMQGTASPTENVESSPLGMQGMSVLVRDGKAWLVVGTRLYAKGQRVNGYTVERISETEVWLRKGSALQKIQRFAGIERSNARPVSQCSASIAIKKYEKNPTVTHTDPSSCEGAS